MIKKLCLLTSVSILALLMQSCGSEDSAKISQSPPPTPTPAVTPPSPPAQPKTPVFATPTPFVASPNTGGLTPSTDPAQRTKEIKQGRQNPFSVITVQPIIKVSPTPVASTKEPPKRKLPSTPVASIKEPPKLKLPSSPPPIPQPNEARAVLVSGVVEVGGIPLAIIQAPGESVARQVTVGTRLANGQVLVKAIDMNQEVPVVILEQYGIQVVRAVGAQPEVASKPTSASTPALPPTTPINPL